MCKYKSGIVVRDEREKGGYRLVMSPWTESHSELETIFKLREGKSLKFAKVEFSPDNMAEAYLVEKYKLAIDEYRTPEWFDDEMKESVASEMADYIKSIIVHGDVELLIGGQFVIAPDSKIQCAKCMVINAMCGGTLTKMCGGTLIEMCGGTLTEMCGGTLTNMWGGTLTKMCGGTLTEMCGGTLIEMWGGTLTKMCGGTLTWMCGGTLTWMCGGTLTVIKSWFNGLIGEIRKWATVIKDERKAKK